MLDCPAFYSELPDLSYFRLLKTIMQLWMNNVPPKLLHRASQTRIKPEENLP